jgi:hypothetical protein
VSRQDGDVTVTVAPNGPSAAPTWPGAGRVVAQSARGVGSRQAERPPQLSKRSQHRFLAYADFLSQKGLARLLPALHQCVAEALHGCVVAPTPLTSVGAKACVDCTHKTRVSARRDRGLCFASSCGLLDESVGGTCDSSSLFISQRDSSPPPTLKRSVRSSRPAEHPARGVAIRWRRHLLLPLLSQIFGVTTAGWGTMGAFGCSVTIKSKLTREGIEQLVDGVRSRYGHAAAVVVWTDVLLPPSDDHQRQWGGGGPGGAGKSVSGGSDGGRSPRVHASGWGDGECNRASGSSTWGRCSFSAVDVDTDEAADLLLSPFVPDASKNQETLLERFGGSSLIGAGVCLPCGKQGASWTRRTRPCWRRC